MGNSATIHPSLRIELDFKGNVEFLISWSLVKIGKKPSVGINFAHAGNDYVKNVEGKDCEFELEKSINEKGNKISEFTITEFKTRTGQQASFALKYNIHNALGQDGSIYEYSIPKNGLPFAKKEQNGLEALMFDLPNTLFSTSSLLAVYPFPDNIIEINERTRLIYEKDKLEDSDGSFHIKFSKDRRDTTWYLIIVGIISGVIASSVQFMPGIAQSIFKLGKYIIGLL